MPVTEMKPVVRLTPLPNQPRGLNRVSSMRNVDQVSNPHWWQQQEFSSSCTAGDLVLVLNKDQFKGKWKQFKGELMKKGGNFTDDDLLYSKGRQDKQDGKIQERYGDREVEIKKWVDHWFEQSKTAPHMKP
jgi:uncharacterized protein YjbJ (UPF0337 family)